MHCFILHILIFKETGTKLKQFEKRKVHVNDQLSPNYLVLVRKFTRDEVVFLHVHVRQNSSEYLRNILGDLEILSEPYEKSWHSQHKNAMSINLKKVAGIISSQVFENVPQKRPRILAQFLVTAVTIFMGGLAILVSLIIKLSP